MLCPFSQSLPGCRIVPASQARSEAASGQRLPGGSSGCRVACLSAGELQARLVLRLLPSASQVCSTPELACLQLSCRPATASQHMSPSQMTAGRLVSWAQINLPGTPFRAAKEARAKLLAAILPSVEQAVADLDAGKFDQLRRKSTMQNFMATSAAEGDVLTADKVVVGSASCPSPASCTAAPQDPTPGC